MKLMDLLDKISKETEYGSREIRISWKPVTWLFGRARNPLHPKALRMVDLHQKDVIRVIDPKYGDLVITLNAEPYFAFHYWRKTKAWTAAWWMDCNCEHSDGLVIKDDFHSLSDLGIVPGRDWRKKRFSPHRYAVGLLMH